MYPGVLKPASIYQHKFHSPFEETLMPWQPDKQITLFSYSLLPIELVARRKRKFSKLTRSRGKKNADALNIFPPAFRATALPCQSITGEPLDPPLVPDAAFKANVKQISVPIWLQSSNGHLLICYTLITNKSHNPQIKMPNEGIQLVSSLKANFLSLAFQVMKLPFA